MFGVVSCFLSKVAGLKMLLVLDLNLVGYLITIFSQFLPDGGTMGRVNVIINNTYIFCGTVSR